MNEARSSPRVSTRNCEAGRSGSQSRRTSTGARTTRSSSSSSLSVPIGSNIARRQTASGNQQRQINPTPTERIAPIIIVDDRGVIATHVKLWPYNIQLRMHTRPPPKMVTMQAIRPDTHDTAVCKRARSWVLYGKQSDLFCRCTFSATFSATLSSNINDSFALVVSVANFFNAFHSVECRQPDVSNAERIDA